MAVVGESGSGKTTLLQLLSAQLAPVGRARLLPHARRRACATSPRSAKRERRFLFRTDWGYVHQDPALGLRMAVSAGANVGERLMAVGWRHYGRIRGAAAEWLDRVEIDARPHRRSALAPIPAACASACRSPAISSPIRASSSWTSRPAASMSRCRRACLDLIRGLVAELGLAAVIVTHDLAVARLLSHRVMVMKDGEVIETGLTDQVLDDPREPYTQLLVSSILPA